MTGRSSSTRPIANYVLAWRIHRDIGTQVELARMTGLASQTISRLESGTIGASCGVLAKIADALDCLPGDLISYPPEPPRDFQRIYHKLRPSRRAELIATVAQFERGLP